jgi:two-component system LytT family sensor kinase
MKLLFSLVEAMSVFLVIAYLYCKSPGFKPLMGESLRRRDKLYLYVFFSAISVMGTYLGLPVSDAIANTRAIGPVLAGIIGGPVLGLAVGFTGGLHRYFLGGFTAFSCGLSTTTEGLIGGLVYYFLCRRDRAELVFMPKVAFATAFCAEIVQMIIILIFARPYSNALALVKMIAIPMIVSSSIGSALFMSIIRDQKNRYDSLGVLFSDKAFKIAERTLNIMQKGFTGATAFDIAQIIYQETGVGAVAITDTEKVLAFVGTGSDHHKPGSFIASSETRKAISEHQVIFMDGVNDHYYCSLTPKCALGSVLIVPLLVDSDVIGTIKLYEPRNKSFLNMNKSLGEGIARLLSSQLLLSRYQQQKNLLTIAELKLIHAQIDPHFLFNTLNTIISILRKDAVRARDLLIELSNFFRKNLKRNTDLSTLQEELDHVSSYLKIEKARFEDRLVVETAIDPTLLDLKIPTFTLQPLVENAIKHGISQMLDQGVTRISAFRENGLAIIEIEDNAGTYDLAKQSKDGLGINIVDKRIKNLLGQEFGTTVTCIPHEMTRVTVRFPAEGCRQ